jgi:hypothetical protein
MKRTILPDTALRDLRSIGDPDLDGRIPKPSGVLEAVRNQGLYAFAQSRQWVKMVRGGGPPPPAIALEPEKLSEAQRLFAVFGTEIAGALLLAALPQSYATAFGAGVLGANERLESDLVRRIRGTAQFLMAVMERARPAGQHDLWAPSDEPSTHRDGPAPWEVCTALRIYHAAIRSDLHQRRKDGNEQVSALLGEHNDPPLNQEDLLCMLLSFSITVFEVLERYGIHWTADEQDAYLHAWDVIGAHLGIGTPAVVCLMESEHQAAAKAAGGEPSPALTDAHWHGLRPPTVDDTRALLDQMRVRQWIDTSPQSPFEIETWSSARAGRILTKALLDELAAAMPPPLALLPLAVMRALAPEVVRTRLSLGTNGLILRALGALPKRTYVIDRFTALHAPNPVGGRVLRMLANEVTSRATLRFVREGDFVIPGLDASS